MEYVMENMMKMMRNLSKKIVNKFILKTDSSLLKSGKICHIFENHKT